MRSRSPRFMPTIGVAVSTAAILVVTAACGGGKVRNGDSNGTAKQITVAVSDSPSATALKASPPSSTARAPASR